MTITLNAWMALPAAWSIGWLIFVAMAFWFDDFDKDAPYLWIVFGLIPALLMVLTRMLP